LTPNFSFAPDGPLSLRERAGARGRRQPEIPLSPVSTVREQARAYRLTPNFSFAPDGSLSLRERAGVRGRRQPETPLSPVSTVREQARSYEKLCLPMRWG